MKKLYFITLCALLSAAHASAQWTAPSTPWKSRDLRNANKLIDTAASSGSTSTFITTLQQIYTDAGTDPNNLGRYGQLFMQNALQKWQNLVQQVATQQGLTTTQKRSLQNQFPYQWTKGGGSGSGSGTGTSSSSGNGSASGSGSAGGSTTITPPAPKLPPTQQPKTPSSNIPTPPPLPPSPYGPPSNVPTAPVLPPNAPMPPALPPSCPRLPSSPAAVVLAPGVYFKGLCAQADKLTVPSGISKDNQAFWSAITNKNFNSSVLVKFKKNITVKQMLSFIQPLQKDDILGIENPDAQKFVQMIQTSGADDSAPFNAVTFSNFAELLETLKMADSRTFWYVLDAACPVRNVMSTIDSAIVNKTLQHADPSVLNLENKLASLVYTQPAQYAMGAITDYSGCIEKIPAGDLKDAFQNTLLQIITIANALQLVATSQQTMATIATAQQTATTSVADVTTIITTVKTASDTYLDTCLAPEYPATLSYEQVQEKKNTFEDQKAKDLKLADSIKTAQNQITSTNTTIKTTAADLNKKISGLMTIMIDVNAKDTDFVSKNPTTRITLYNGELITLNTTATLNPVGPTPPPATSITALDREYPFAQYYTGSPEEYVAAKGQKSPIGYSALNVLFSNPGADTANDKLAMQIGILRKDYNLPPNPLDGLKNNPTKNDLAPLINADGSVDLYVWGPEVKGPKDLYIYNKTIGVNKTGTVSMTVRINNPIPPVNINTRLYKVATYSQAQIKKLIGATLPPLDRNTKNVTDYIFQPLLKRITAFLPA